MFRIRPTFGAILFLALAITPSAGIINSSFEAPVQGTAQYLADPAGVAVGWTFQRPGGVVSNGYGELATSSAMDGNQAAVLGAATTATSNYADSDRFDYRQ